MLSTVILINIHNKSHQQLKSKMANVSQQLLFTAKEQAKLTTFQRHFSGRQEVVFHT